MTNEEDALFQERIDELVFIEQGIERRAKEFLALNKDYQEKSQGALTDLLDQVGGIDESLSKINAASNSVDKYVTLSAKHAARTTQLFLGTLVAVVLIVSGTFWWSHRINSDLTDAKTELARLNVTLQHKPVILHFQGNDYVRVVPDSEMGFTRGNHGEVPGRYAKMWHIR